MTHQKLKCPNCGRSLTENEIYCYFCELDVLKLLKEQEKNLKKRH